MGRGEIKICAVMERKSGVSYHRLEIPMSDLGKRDDLHITLTNGFTEDHRPDQYDIIIVNRVLSQPRDYIREAKEAGVKIILDLDDWIDLPEWHSGNNGHYNDQIKQRIESHISVADHIWCASEHLMHTIYDNYPVHHPRISYVPNAIDFSQKQFESNKQKSERYTIGWIGGTNHHRDIEKLAVPLERLQKNQANYDLLLGGANSSDMSTAAYWNYIRYVMTSKGQLKQSRFKTIEALDCYNYAFMYNYCDLMLAPLCNDVYSQCKSSLKVLEAGAFSLPIICSNVAPYKEFIRQGLVYTCTDNWDRRIRELIKHPQKGVQMGARLHEYIREYYTIEKVNQTRLETIQSIL